MRSIMVPGRADSWNTGSRTRGFTLPDDSTNSPQMIRSKPTAMWSSRNSPIRRYWDDPVTIDEVGHREHHDLVQLPQVALSVHHNRKVEIDLKVRNEFGHNLGRLAGIYPHNHQVIIFVQQHEFGQGWHLAYARVCTS